MQAIGKKFTTLPNLAITACYLCLTALVWGIFVFDRGISALDEPNIIQEILSHARYGPLAQLFISVAPPGRYFLLTPYTIAIWSGHPIIVMQIIYGIAWLLTGVLAFVLTRQLLAHRPMAYLAGALTLTATGDFFTDYLGVMGGYLAGAYYFASLACLLAWWKQRRIRWAVASGVLLLLSMWTIEYAMAAILLTPLLLWALDYFRISKHLIVTAVWWYTLVFSSMAVLLTGILRPGDHRNDVLFASVSIADRIWQTLDYFVYNFAPHRWLLREIPAWFAGYAPIFAQPLRIALVLVGIGVFLAVAVMVFRQQPRDAEARSQWYRYTVVGVACLVMALGSNAAMSSMGTDYFIRSHLISRVWSSIAIALFSYSLGAFVIKRPYAALLIPTLFVGSGIYSGIERQDYQIGIWRRQQVELQSIVEQVPAVKPDTLIVLLVPPGAHPLLATSNINYLPALYGDDTVQQRVFYWGSNWHYYSRCTAEAGGLACRLLGVAACGSSGECPARHFPYNKIVLLVYSLSQNRFVLQHDIPAGILQGVTAPPEAYNPAERIEDRPLPAYAQSLLYDASPFAATLPNAPDPEYQSSLIRVEAELSRSVKADVIDPWRSEQSNGQATIWLGPDQNYGLDGWIWSEKEQAATLKLQVAPGPAREDLLRTLRLDLGSGAQSRVQYQQFTAPALYSPVEVRFNIQLQAGRNDFRLVVLEPVLVPQQPNGDTRLLLVRLDQIAIGAQAATPAMPSPGCLMTVDEGWYDYEHVADDWWRWTRKQGTIHLMVDQATKATLRGYVYAAQPPNTIAVLVNGVPQTSIEATTSDFAAFEITAIPLKDGVNEVAFVSANPPVRIGTDSRQLAIAVRNLQLATEAESNCTTLQR